MFILFIYSFSHRSLVCHHQTFFFSLYSIFWLCCKKIIGKESNIFCKKKKLNNKKEKKMNVIINTDDLVNFIEFSLLSVNKRADLDLILEYLDVNDRIANAEDNVVSLANVLTFPTMIKYDPLLVETIYDLHTTYLMTETELCGEEING